MLYCSRSIHLCFDLSVEDQETVDTLLVSHREQLWKLEPWIAHHGLGHAPPSRWRLCDASAGVDTKCGHVNVAKDGLLQTGPRLVRLILAKRCDKSRLRSDCLVQIKCQMPLCVGLLNDTMSNCVIITMLRLTYVKHQPVCFVFTCRLSSAQTRSMVSEKDFTLFSSSSVFF